MSDFLHKFVFDSSFERVEDKSFVGSDGRVVKVEKESSRPRSFPGKLGSAVLGVVKNNTVGLAKDLLVAAAEDVAGLFNTSLGQLKKATNLEGFREAFRAFRATDLSKLSEDDLEALIKEYKRVGNIKNARELVRMFRKELDRLEDIKADESRRKLSRDDSQLSTDDRKQLDKMAREEDEAAEDVLRRVEDIVKDEDYSWDDVEGDDDGDGDGDAGDDGGGDDADGDGGDDGVEYELPIPLFGKDLKPIAHGRVDLPNGVYILSASGSVADVDDLSFALTIEYVLNWKAYQQYVSAARSGKVSQDELDALADASLDLDAMSSYEGMDFMDLLKNNEVSGDIEAEFGYVPIPVGEGKPIYLANVNTTNNAFTISANSDDVGVLMMPNVKIVV